ncbi:catabolite control protein A [Arthrobacter sp. Hiyo1]|nr:catabolite control protein A [Arthrobacter sp. Hiyo1]
MASSESSAKVTLAAIAREAGVSMPTVSKVVNGREDVAADTRAKVLTALERTGYKSPLQRKNTAGRRPVVEVVFDTLNSAYGVEVLNGVLEHAAASDVEVLLNITGQQSASKLSLEQRAQRIVDEGRSGMIVVTSAFSSAQLDPFRRRQIPHRGHRPAQPAAG